MNSGENNRDYKKEHERRKERHKRLIADIDKNKVESFQTLLKGQDMTYTAWLITMIDKELSKV